MKKTALTSLLSLALWPLGASAVTVGAPHPGNVTATTYSASGGFHGAVDLSSGRTCYWTVTTAVKASLSWNVTARNTAQSCAGGAGGVSNEAKHTFATGYTFRLWHFIYVASLTKDKTCDRCEIGDESNAFSNSPSHATHLQADKSGTNNTAWYSGTTKGEYLDAGEVIGTLG